MMPLHPIGYFEFKPTYKLDADDMGILDVHQCWLTKENSKLSWLKDVTSLSRLESSAWTTTCWGRCQSFIFQTRRRPFFKAGKMTGVSTSYVFT